MKNGDKTPAFRKDGEPDYKPKKVKEETKKIPIGGL